LTEPNNFMTVFQLWFIMLWGREMLTVNENMALRKVFEPKREETAEHWRKVHNERFRDFYSSWNIKWVTKSKKARRAEHVTLMGDERNVCMLLEGKPENQGRHERQWCGWRGNIKMDLTEIQWNILSKIGTSIKLLSPRQWTVGFHDMWGISSVTEELPVFQGLRST